MKSHGGLFEGICAFENLDAAMRRAARGKASRGPVRLFAGRAETELPALREELLAGSYTPRPYSQFRILDPKPRLISCADFRDRVVHHAVCAAIGPVIDRRLIDDNFACRKGRGSHRAILRAREFARRLRYFLKTDIRRYYESVDHGALMEKVGRLFRERALVELIGRIVRAPMPGQVPGKGLPIGNLTSQWLANLYLDEIDHWVKEEREAPGYARYMDDIAVWSDSKEFLWELAGDLDERLGARLSIGLKQDGTIVAPVSEGMPFLGWRVFPGFLRVRPSRLRRSRRLLLRREGQYARGEITGEQLQACVRSMDGPRRYLGFGPSIGARRKSYNQFGTAETRLEPGEPGRELEERRRVELPGVEPEQQRPRQPQRQHGFSSREHSYSPCPGRKGQTGGKDIGLSHPPHPVSREAGTKPTAAPRPVIPHARDQRGGAAHFSTGENPCQ